MNYTGKTIWITGASSGIGEAMAKELAKTKCKLILSGRNLHALKEVEERCIKLGSRVQLAPFDLGKSEEVNDVAKAVIESNETIDCLINVGGLSQRSLVSETSIEIDRKIFEINFFGTIALTKALLPIMIRQGGGQIVATSSIVGKFGFPLRSAYSASKHALHGFFESLRAENVHNNIKVSLIIPGRINTSISINAIDADGKKYGLLDDGQASGMDVDKSARIIIRKLKAEKKEILVGGKELLMVHIRRFLPFLYYKLSSKINPK
jgi:short-subunit dehydrogenase